MALERINEYDAVWNNKTGFWKAKIGCQLPQELKSTTCLSHHCKKLPEQQEKLLFTLKIFGFENDRKKISFKIFYVLKKL